MYWRRTLALFLLGLPGIAALPVLLLPVLRADPPRGEPLPPDIVLVPLLMLQPALILALAVALGAALAPRLGLTSVLGDAVAGGVRPRLSGKDLGLALLCGALLAVVIAAVDLLLFRAPLAGPIARLESLLPRDPLTTLASALYGGLVEELLLRWGLMTLLVWAGWRWLQGGRGAPSAPVLWGANLVAALAFGAAHLGFVAAVVPLDGLLAARTVLLNTLAGLAFGALYARRSLEAAMLAHAAFHPALSLILPLIR